MKILFTKHALEKFGSLALLGWKFEKEDVKQSLLDPDHFSEDKERGVKIILKEIDKNHNLRIVYREDDGIITIVTFYPCGKGRYEITQN